MRKAAVAFALVVAGLVALGVSIHAAAGADLHATGECVLCNALCWLVESIH
jgi:hypothetical protein